MLSPFSIFCYAGNAVSLVVNALLVALSLNWKMDVPRDLRLFFANTGVVAMVQAVVLMLLQPQSVHRGMITTRVPHGIVREMQDNHVKYIAVLGIAAYTYKMLSFPLVFIYRFITIASTSNAGGCFSPRCMMIFFGLMAGIGIAQGTLYYLATPGFDELYDNLNGTDIIEQLTDRERPIFQILVTTASPVETTTMGVIDWRAMNTKERDVKIVLFGEDLKDPLSIYFYGSFLALHLIAYLTVIFGGQCMLNTIKQKSANLSQQAAGVQQVIAVAVLTAAASPLPFLVPLLANAALVLVFQNSLWWQEYLPTILLTITPMMPTIAVLFGISQYRAALVSLVRLEFLRPVPPEKPVEDDGIDAERMKEINDMKKK